MSQYIKATLLQVVNKSHQTCAATRICDHQQHLEPPEFHVILTHVQHQQVFAHLDLKKKKTKNFMWLLLQIQQLQCGYLVEDKGLADVAPVADGTEVLDKH